MDTPERLRIIFMGTSEFAKIVLERLYSEEKFEIVAAVAQPDKLSGRGLKKCEFGAVKKFALENKLKLFQPASLKEAEVFFEIKNLKPDFIIVAAYGKMIPNAIINVPKYDCINVHASLLPAFRGAAPIQRAIMESWKGPNETGVSIMRVISELDAGPVYAQKKIAINDHTSDSLFFELAQEGASLLIQTIKMIVDNALAPTAQDKKGVSYAPKLTKEDGLINCNNSVEQIDAQIRAVESWPGARFNLLLEGRSDPVNIQFKISGFEKSGPRKDETGKIIREANTFKIICKNGYLILDKIKPQGKNWMSPRDYFNGQKCQNSEICGFIIS